MIPLNKNTCQFDSCQGASRAWRARRDAPRFPQVRSHKSPLRATASILPVLTKATGGPWRAPYHPHALKSNRPPTASSGASPPSTFAGAGKPWPPSHYRFPWVRVHAWGCVCRRSSMRAGGQGGGCIELCNCDVAWWPYEREKWWTRDCCVWTISIGFLFQGVTRNWDSRRHRIRNFEISVMEVNSIGDFRLGSRRFKNSFSQFLE